MKLAALVLAALPLPALACPTLNGTYVSKQGTTTLTVQILTAEEAGTPRYKLGAAGFVAADGVSHEVELDGRHGFVAVSCSGDSVTIRSQEEGVTPVSMTLTGLGPNQIRVTSDVEMANAVYTRQ